MPAVVRYERQEPGELWILRSSGGLMALAISSVARAGSFLCAVISPVDAVPPYPAAPWRGCARTETGPVPGVRVDEARRPCCNIAAVSPNRTTPASVGVLSSLSRTDSAVLTILSVRYAGVTTRGAPRVRRREETFVTTGATKPSREAQGSPR